MLKCSEIGPPHPLTGSDTRRTEVALYKALRTRCPPPGTTSCTLTALERTLTWSKGAAVSLSSLCRRVQHKNKIYPSPYCVLAEVTNVPLLPPEIHRTPAGFTSELAATNPTDDKRKPAEGKTNTTKRWRILSARAGQCRMTTCKEC